MAGGEGSRLRPITTTRPKPLVPLVNRPILWHVLRLLREHRVRDVHLTLHYLAEHIVTTFGDGSDLGLHIAYALEERPLGTAGGVKRVAEHLDDTFLVLSGDVITDINLTKALEFHRKVGAVATLTLTRVVNPLEYGVVVTDEEGRVTRFLEKPSWGEVYSDTVNTGIYILEPEVLQLVKEGEPFDFSKNLFPLLLKRGDPIYGYVAEGYWCDIGVPQQYITAHHQILEGNTHIKIPGNPKAPTVWVEGDFELDPSAIIEGPVLLGEGVKIGRSAKVGPYTTLGPGVRVEEGAKVERSVVYSQVHVGRDCELKGCVVGQGVILKPRARVLEGAVIADRCQLGAGSEVTPGVKIWPDKVIEAGSVVKVNLIWGVTWQRSLFSRHGIYGLTNIEITPEMTARLGAAFGTFVGRGGMVVSGRDNFSSSRMLKRAFLAGLLSAGVGVYDLRAVTLPLARFSVAHTESTGGAYFTLSEYDQDYASIILFDRQGVDLARDEQRKIEGVLFREEIRRVATDEVRDIIYPTRLWEAYTGQLRQLTRQVKGESPLKIIVDCSYGTGSMVAPSFLTTLGCEVITINAGERPPRPATGFASLYDIVTAVGAAVGFKFSVASDTLRVVDEKGHLLSGDEALVVLLSAFLSLEPVDVAVPVSASRAVERLAERHGVRVIRTKTEPRALMEAVLSGRAGLAANETGAFILSREMPYPDALLAAARVVEFLARRGIRLSDIRRQVYQPTMARGVVHVPWEVRGRVLRRLTTEPEHERIDTPEGVKFLVNDGWVLITPSPDEPVLNIVAEATSLKKAHTLVREFQAWIQDLLQVEA
jgi:mannose-1-phosphate guanylyltransferase/phosphomannomutase